MLKRKILSFILAFIPAVICLKYITIIVGCSEEILNNLLIFYCISFAILIDAIISIVKKENWKHDLAFAIEVISGSICITATILAKFGYLTSNAVLFIIFSISFIVLCVSARIGIDGEK